MPQPGTRILKRALDVLISGLGLAFSAPLWLIFAVLIKLEDAGPVFYCQERVGQDGKRFTSRKFRSMVPDSDRFGLLQVRKGDARITRIGGVLRATALDELPQLWNIFMGEMSIVGPRPLAPEEIEVRGPGRPVRLEEIPGFLARHSVRPGLTGLAQIYAPRDAPRRSKFRLDLLYVQKRCLLLDIRLILLSFWITCRGKWEERGTKIW